MSAGVESPTAAAAAAPSPAAHEPGDEATVPSTWVGLRWLCLRECHRVLKVWKQTILAPVVSSLLFMVVFGIALGDRISKVGNTEYSIFIVPGLIAMAMAQAAYSNNSSSVFQARSDRFIDDILAAPMHAWQMTAGYLCGAVFRSLIIGIALTALAIPITGVGIENPLPLAIAALLLVAGFGSLGTIVGIYAKSWDNQSFVNNLVILPLIFLGGVFYSVDRLGSPWQQISHANPLFYVVDAIRFGFLGEHDVSPWISFAVLAVISGLLAAWSLYLFASGRRLKQ